MTGPEGRIYVQHAAAEEGSTVVQVAGNLIVSDGSLSAPWRLVEAVPGECPYPGLDAFGPGQAKWFFGRDKLTGDLLDRLDKSLQAGHGGPAVVVGPSGAGKSSLLGAGLLRALQEGRLAAAGSGGWPILNITPGTTPLGTLTSTISMCAEALTGEQAAPPPDPADPAEAWATAVAALRAALRTRGVERAPQRVMIVVDQFEELFTAGCSDAEHQAFLGGLAALAAPGPDGPVGLVVLGLRADFYSLATEHPVLRQALESSQLVLGAMTADEVTQAITGPARAAGLRLEDGLAGRLLRDLGVAADGAAYEAGRLPLLAYALRSTWQRRSGDLLTIEGYGETGGIGGAIAKAAEDVYTRLDAAGRRVAQQLFLAMVQVGSAPSSEGIPDTRRRLGRERLCSLTSDAALARKVLDLFTEARLVTSGRQTVEISHDALLSRWPRLKSWIDQDRSGHLIHQSLDEAAEVWNSKGRDPAALYVGIRLSEAQQWADDTGQARNLSPVARSFLAASGRRRRRAIRRRNEIITILAALSVGLALLTGYAFNQRTSAIQQRDQAIYDQVFNEALQSDTSNTPLAAQLTLAAYRMQPTQDMASRLVSTENTPLSRSFGGGGGDIGTVAFSPNDRTLVTRNENGTFRLWDVADPAHARPLTRSRTGGGPHNYADAVAVSPDGRTLASGNTDGSTQLWDITDPVHPRPLGPPLTSSSRGSSVIAEAFSTDGRTLATSNLDGAFRLWDVADRSHPRPLGQPLISGSTSSTRPTAAAVAFSSDSHLLASGDSGGTMHLWNVADPAHPRPLGQPLTNSSDNSVWAVTFSPHTHVLASSNTDGTIRLWDVTDPVHPQPLGQPLTSGSGNFAYSVAFSPDSHILASGNNDGTIRLWDVTNPAHPLQLGQPLATGTDLSVYAVAFSHDGHFLASGYRGGTIRLWSLPATVLTSASRSANTVAFSPDDRTLASGNSDGTIQLWDVTDLKHPRPDGQPLTIGTHLRAYAVTFSHDSHILAISCSDGTVHLWDVTDPAHPWMLSHIVKGDSGIGDVAFSPDDHILASADQGAKIQLWDIAKPAHPRPLGQPMTLGGANGTMSGVGFIADKRILIGVGNAGTIRLWNVNDPAHPRLVGQYLSNTASADTVAFSPDGRTLAGGNTERTIPLWDIADPAHPRLIAQPSISGVGVAALAFSHDGRILASDNTGGKIGLWDTTDPAHPRSLGQFHTNGGISLSTLAFSSRADTLASGDIEGITQLWNLDPRDAIRRICATAGDLTSRQWHQYIPQSAYRPACTS